MKKILYVNGKFLSQPITGVQRYAFGVVSAWDEALSRGEIDSSKYAIKILAPNDSRTSTQFKNIEIEIAPSLIKGKIWEQFYLPLRSLGGLLFSPYAAAPILKLKHVVTIHDAGVSATPQQYSKAFRVYYRFVYRILGKFARKIFTVSEFSKAELQKHFAIATDKLLVARPGYEQIQARDSDSDILKKRGLTKGKFVLGVSSRSPIKNFKTLLRACEKLDRRDIRLVVAGGSNSKVFGNVAAENADSAVFLGYVNDAELRALYENAACFVYPSLYEGFGLPPVEAMACGCPVVVSTCNALPETCGTAALYCEPFDEIGFRDRIEAIIDNTALAQDLRRRGSERVKDLTYKNCAAILWNSIKELI